MNTRNFTAEAEKIAETWEQDGLGFLGAPPTADEIRANAEREAAAPARLAEIKAACAAELADPTIESPFDFSK